MTKTTLFFCFILFLIKILVVLGFGIIFFLISKNFVNGVQFER